MVDASDRTVRHTSPPLLQHVSSAQCFQLDGFAGENGVAHSWSPRIVSRKVTCRSTNEEENEKRANGADVSVSDGDDAVLGGETTYKDEN